MLSKKTHKTGEIENLVELLKARPEEYRLEDDKFALFLKQHDMLINPFSDRSVSGKMFINKDDVACRRIMGAITHNQSSINFLIGPTGSGKSENADFMIRMMPEDYIFWYNQIYGQNSRQLALSIMGGLDPKYISKLNDVDRDRILDIYGTLLNALPRHRKKLLCIFDQGEQFTKDGFELVVNSTNPHYNSERAFTALILAVPRFEKHLEEWSTSLDTALRRALIREYTRPFTNVQSLEYILKGISISKNRSYKDTVKNLDFDPFTEGAILRLIALSEGHPSTLNGISYLSLELASLEGSESMVTEDTVESAWKKFPNKSLHVEAIKWYKEKGLV
jgi:hypothetical protein